MVFLNFVGRLTDFCTLIVDFLSLSPGVFWIGDNHREEDRKNNRWEMLVTGVYLLSVNYAVSKDFCSVTLGR